MFTFGDLDNFQFLNIVSLQPYQLNERIGIQNYVTFLEAKFLGF